MRRITTPIFMPIYQEDVAVFKGRTRFLSTSADFAHQGTYATEDLPAG
jgi:hypothetical protein